MPPKAAIFARAAAALLLLAAPPVAAARAQTKVEDLAAANLPALANPPAIDGESGPPPLPPRSTVYAVRDDAAVSERYAVNPGRVRAMFDRVLFAVSGQTDAARAWRELGVTPADIVGIKIAAAGGAAAPARRAVVAAVVESLLAAGHPRERILVWDRDANDLLAAGFLGPDAAFHLCPVAAITPREGYDPQAVLSSPALGKLIWGDLLFRGLSPRASLAVTSAANEADDPLAAKKPSPRPNTGPSAPADNLSSQSHWATLVSKRVTKIVNLPTFSDSVFTGLAGALYNVTVPNLDNWRRFTGGPRFGNPYVAELFAEPVLRGKVVLNLCDGLLAQLAGGPVFQPLYARRQNTLYASRDAVALDAVTLRLLELWRTERGLPSLERAAGHVRSAAELGLGHYSAETIDLRNLSP